MRLIRGVRLVNVACSKTVRKPLYLVRIKLSNSRATVSRVVNGNKNVKENTRKKVLEVIERLDYRPNAVARGLASQKTTTVGVVIPNITNSNF